MEQVKGDAAGTDEQGEGTDEDGDVKDKHGIGCFLQDELPVRGQGVVVPGEDGKCLIQPTGMLAGLDEGDIEIRCPARKGLEAFRESQACLEAGEDGEGWGAKTRGGGIAGELLQGLEQREACLEQAGQLVIEKRPLAGAGGRFQERHDRSAVTTGYLMAASSTCLRAPLGLAPTLWLTT